MTSGFFTLSEGMSRLFFAFGSFYLLARTLTKEDFGAWVLFMAIVSIVEVARVGLMQNGLVKYLATAKEGEYERISTASLVLHLIITGLVVVLFAGLAYPVATVMHLPVLSKLFFIYIFTTLVLLPFNQSNFTHQANLNFKGIFFGNTIRQAAFFTYVLVMYLSKRELTLTSLAFFQIIAALMGMVVTVSMARSYFLFSKKIDWSWVKKLFHYGKYVFGTNLSAMLYKSIDKLMLGMFPNVAGAVAVSLYEAAMKVTNLSEVPTFSMAAILFPQSAKRMEQGREAIRLLYEKAVGAILAVLIPAIIVVVLFADLIVRILAGAEYSAAAPVLRLTIFYGFFIPFAVQFGTVLDSVGKPKINFYFTLMGMVLNVIFNYFFISHYGVFGAAYGTLLSYGMMFVVMQIVLYREFGVKAWRVFGYSLAFYKKMIGFGLRKIGFAE